MKMTQKLIEKTDKMSSLEDGIFDQNEIIKKAQCEVQEMEQALAKLKKAKYAKFLIIEKATRRTAYFRKQLEALEN